MIFDEASKDGSKITPEGSEDFIRHSADAPPVSVPRGYVGPVYMSTGRLVWWTGRVAIGLRHRSPQRCEGVMTQSAQWLQGLMLGKGRAGAW